MVASAQLRLLPRLHVRPYLDLGAATQNEQGEGGNKASGTEENCFHGTGRERGRTCSMACRNPAIGFVPMVVRERRLHCGAGRRGQSRWASSGRRPVAQKAVLVADDSKRGGELPDEGRVRGWIFIHAYRDDDQTACCSQSACAAAQQLRKGSPTGRTPRSPEIDHHGVAEGFGAVGPPTRPGSAPESIARAHGGSGGMDSDRGEDEQAQDEPEAGKLSGRHGGRIR